MLECVKISNLALISESVVEFKNGFNVLTGETGAGKSLIVDALLFLTGIRADKTFIKSGEEFAKVEGVFTVDINNKELNEVLSSVSIENEGTLILSRYFSLSGKNECRINGDIVTLNILRKVAVFLIDIFGQNDSQVLLNPNNHLSLFDNIIESKLIDLKEQLDIKLKKLFDINSQIKELGGIDEDREKNIDFIKFQINEINDANLYDGLEEELINKISTMENAEKIYTSLNNTYQLLNEDVNVTSVLKQSINNLSNIDSYCDEISKEKNRLFSLKYELEDILSNISSYKDKIVYSEFELDKLNDDLSAIKNLERKYGNKISDILLTRDSLLNKLNKLENCELELEKLSVDKENLLNDIYIVCKDLHNVRLSESVKFKEKLIEQLKLLGMKNASFDIDFSNNFNRDNIEEIVTLDGADNIEFLFSANLGVAPMPLSKIISGGEMSRFMLAFKVIQNNGSNKTCIFDEIDTGIGGEIGVVIGKKICDISKKTQVICVTHLSQIASFGDANYKIEKFEEDNKTITTVKFLNEENKILEIARMIGNSNNLSAINHAREIIEEANQYKNYINS